MILKIFTPSRIFLQEDCLKVVAEAVNGSFCLLPRHLDMVSSLVPGILSYVSLLGEEIFVAVHAGILVKCGEEVLVSTTIAVKGKELGTLRNLVHEEFERVDDRERLARTASAHLEATLVRRFVEMGKE
ncbi:MAG: F0F1 ATP synthase subunit epsilon [Bdellovibrionales bacterium]